MGFAVRGGALAVVVFGAVASGGTARAQPAEPAAPAAAPAPAPPGPSAAAPAMSGGGLRLADVIAVAVRQSPDLERARIDLATARGQLLQAEGSEDTHVGAQATASAVHTNAEDPFGESDQSVVALSASVRHTFSTGGSLSVTAGGDRERLVGIQRQLNALPLESGTAHRYSASLAFEVIQPLLRGAGGAAFEAPILQAAHQRDAAALAQEAKARDLVVSLAQAYWQVAFAWRQLDVRRASLDLAQKQLAFTEGAIRSEKVARSEALAVQQVIAVRKQDVIAGEQEVYERSIALRQLAGLEIGPDALELTTEALPVQVDAAAIDLPAAVRGAFAHSAELASLDATRRAAETALAAADNAAKSRLDFAATGKPIAADTTPIKALSAVVQHPGYEIQASLTFDHAIEGRTERGGQEVARAAVLRATVAERDARARLAMRATRAVQRAQAALASIALGAEAIGLAEQNITAEQKRFELGKSTNFDVLRRQDELEQARLRHASAIADYLAARADLDGLSGAILLRYGIVMP